MCSRCFSAAADKHTPSNLLRAIILQAFWRTVLAFPLDKRKRFLFFCTGCDR